jgi:hypothetical protein
MGIVFEAKMNKGGMGYKSIVAIVMTILGVMIVGMIHASVLQNTVDKSLLEACRQSIVTAEEMVQTSKIGVEYLRFPLVCVTQEVKIPNVEDLGEVYLENEEDAKRNLADLIVDTHYEFYEGKADKNVFGQMFKVDGRQKCFVAFNVSINDDFAIPINDFAEYIETTKYEPIPTEPVSNADNPDKIKTGCERKGGICKKVSGVDEVYYEDWFCLGKDKCFVKEENMITYSEYIEKPDLVKLVIDDIGSINPNNDYAIVFVSPTENAANFLTGVLAMSTPVTSIIGAAIIYDQLNIPNKYSFIIFTEMDKVSKFCISNLED